MMPPARKIQTSRPEAARPAAAGQESNRAKRRSEKGRHVAARALLRPSLTGKLGCRAAGQPPQLAPQDGTGDPG